MYQAVHLWASPVMSLPDVYGYAYSRRVIWTGFGAFPFPQCPEKNVADIFVAADLI